MISIRLSKFVCNPNGGICHKNIICACCWWLYQRESWSSSSVVLRGLQQLLLLHASRQYIEYSIHNFLCSKIIRFPPISIIRSYPSLVRMAAPKPLVPFFVLGLVILTKLNSFLYKPFTTLVSSYKIGQYLLISSSPTTSSTLAKTDVSQFRVYLLPSKTVPIAVSSLIFLHLKILVFGHFGPEAPNAFVDFFDSNNDPLYSPGPGFPVLSYAVRMNMPGGTNLSFTLEPNLKVSYVPHCTDLSGLQRQW